MKMPVISLRFYFVKQECQSLTFILILYLVTFGVILPYLCHDHVYSRYFHGEKNSLDYVRRALYLNDHRLADADLYFSGLPQKDPDILRLRFKSQLAENIDVAIGMITVSRLEQEVEFQSGRLGYLTQSAAALHKVTSNSHLGNKRFFLCNVDAAPEKHTEALVLSRVIPTIQRFSTNASTPKGSDVFQKEKDDYSFCLKQGLALKPKYVMLLEDDVLVNSDTFLTTELILNSYVEYNHKRQDEMQPSQPWLFLKLYYPEKWQGYGNEFSKIAELIAIGTLGGSIFAAISLLSRSTNKCFRMFIFFVLGAGYFTLLVFLVGRPYVHHLRHFSPYFYRVVDAPDCCTQAILYPAAMGHGLADYLDAVYSTSAFSVDLAIDKFALQENLKRHLVEPNLVKHIGMLSTVRTYAKSAAEFMF